MRAHKLVTLVGMLGTVAALAAEASKAEVAVKEVTGEAAIIRGDKLKAKEEAKQAALREAVSQVAGVMLQADTATANSTLLYDRIYANSAGYVKKYEVLSEKEERNVMQVTVRAEVITKDLDKDLQAVRQLVREMGSRKLVILLQEQTIDDKNMVRSTNVMSTVLTEVMKKDGWTILDPSFAAGKVKLGPAVSLSSGEAKEIGDLTRADYILYGTVGMRHQLPEANSGMRDANGTQVFYPVTGEYDFAVFATDSGSQLAHVSGRFVTSPEDVGGPVMPAGAMGVVPKRALISYEQTAFAILKNRGGKIAGEVRTPMIESLRDARTNGNRVVMSVSGIEDYKAVQAFKSAMGKVSGVKEVRPGKFGNKKAEFDVVFVGSTDDLARRLGSARFNKKAVAVTGVTGNTLDVKVQ